MTKAAIKRAESQTCLSYPEREQARPKVNDEWPPMIIHTSLVIHQRLQAPFPLFLLFLWDIFIQAGRVFCPTEITEITEIFAPITRSISVISAISVGHFYTSR